jgi:putative membrane protein
MEEDEEEKDKALMQEKLALQRTVLANVRTFLSFLRTSMYFLVAGLSIRSLLHLGDNDPIHIVLYVISGVIFVLGLLAYFRHKKHIRDNKMRIRRYWREYLEED